MSDPKTAAMADQSESRRAFQFGIADLLTLSLGTGIVASCIHYLGLETGIWSLPMVGVVMMFAGLVWRSPPQFSVGISLTAIPLGLVLAYSVCQVEYPDSFARWLLMAVLPAGPLLLIGIMAPFCRSQLAAWLIFGAFLGTLLTSAGPFGMLIYQTSHYRGGGANIGLGLLLLAGPILVPIAMAIGAGMGFAGFKITSRFLTGGTSKL